MKRFLYTALLFASVTVFGQKTGQSPFVLIDGIISSEKMIKSDVPKGEIQTMNVYKTKSAIPENLKSWASVSDNGLTELKLKKNASVYDRISLGEVNEQFKLPKNNPVYVDGRKIENTDLKIYGNVLDNMEVKTIDGMQVLSITFPAK
ncbi:hypothetical protein [Chryseobacterium sp.]|uniref:hypothetical protein n=1 Tax=Chryseobacterium sp. TaxID=1871047 RepID=UPI0011C9D95C|nr:hypothetical protein [Chryseobacterium sp.]TXF79166.1 hypothetical protein FUA25_01870 [Chryseobacterium sp.]